MHNFEAQFARFILKHRWWVIIVTLAAIAAMANGGQHLRFEADYRVYFDEDNEQLVAFEEIENTYSTTDSVMFVLAPADGEIFTRETLSAIRELTEQAWQLTYATRVDSISNFQYTHAQGDDLVVGDLVQNPESLSESELARIRQVATSEPLLVHRLIDPGGRVTAVNIRVAWPGIDKSTEILTVAAAGQAMANAFRAKHPQIVVYIGGTNALDASFPEAAQIDASTLLPLAFAVMMVILLLLLRTLTGTLITLTIIVFSILAAMGLRGYSGFPLAAQSGATPIIILTMAVANCVHLIVSFVNEMRLGKSKHEAIEESLRINLQPVFVASMTTALGFLTLNAVEAPPIRWLGNTVASGVVISFLLSVSFLPALMSLLPVRIAQRAQQETDALTRFGRAVVKYRRRFLIGMAVLIVTLIAFIPKNELNNDPYNWFDYTFAFRQSSDFIEANLSGTYYADYSLDSGAEGRIADPDYLNDVERFATWLRTQPEVVHVSVLTDIMKRLNKNMHGDDPSWYRIADQRDLSAQYLLLYEMSLPYGLDLNDQININKSSIRVTTIIHRVSQKDMVAFDARVQAWIKSNIREFTAGLGAGVNFMFADVNQRTTVNMVISTTIALVLISFLLSFVFRSAKFGVVSLVPNLVPAAMGFGIWGIIDGWIGTELAVVMGMTLGIVIDDTVHFISKYLRARRENGASSTEAVVYTFATVGKALLITSIVLVVGFVILSFSHFGMNSRMAGLTAIVITLALLADFLFLPPLLVAVDNDD